MLHCRRLRLSGCGPIPFPLRLRIRGGVSGGDGLEGVAVMDLDL